MLWRESILKGTKPEGLVRGFGLYRIPRFDCLLHAKSETFLPTNVDYSV